MFSGELPRAPIWDDVTSLRGTMLPGEIDIIYGGFPCQDLSSAGAGRGLAGERSGLYFEIERLVREVKPAFVFLENVPAIRTRGLGRVVWGLSELGYDCRWTVVSAKEIGAPHLRKRWFMLAHANSKRFGDDCRVQARGECATRGNPTARGGWWDVEPDVGRVANGIPKRVDRLRGLGNAVVPLQTKAAFERLVGLE
jgi:DNA (cytosine-5)-methyltransferase 1